MYKLVHDDNDNLTAVSKPIGTTTLITVAIKKNNVLFYI